MSLMSFDSQDERVSLERKRSQWTECFDEESWRSLVHWELCCTCLCVCKQKWKYRYVLNSSPFLAFLFYLITCSCVVHVPLLQLCFKKGTCSFVLAENKWYCNYVLLGISHAIMCQITLTSVEVWDKTRRDSPFIIITIRFLFKFQWLSQFPWLHFSFLFHL